MSLRASFSLTNPDTAEATLTLTMTVGEWRELKGELARDYPAWVLSGFLSGLIAMANEKFHAKQEESHP